MPQRHDMTTLNADEGSDLAALTARKRQYQKGSRARSPRREVVCECGCGRVFTTTDRRKRFFDYECSQVAYKRRQRKEQS